MSRYVLGFEEVDRTQVARVGGKGAHLGELSRLEGVRVPAGFCVTTDAFRRMMAEVPSMDERLGGLARLAPRDREGLRAQSADLRHAIEAAAIPDEVSFEISDALLRLGETAAYAVRSSATTEDSPTASFAGQQDSYLNVVGLLDILQHVSRCWASLFTERAVMYRLRSGLDHRKALMAVVVQRLLAPQAAGVLFTADPLTSNRKLASVEATFGLGAALVAGQVKADVYTVRDGQLATRAIATRAIATKPLALVASPAGGTQAQAIEPARQGQPALTDGQVLRLVALGRQLEAHFGRPQDIEWCLVGEDFHVVQSRPITTLFPVPAAGDQENHVYVSVGHQQMMTDAMKPLGLSLWQLAAARPMAEAGGRLFVDVTGLLASPASRTNLLEVLGRSDPLIRDALEGLVARGDFIRASPGGASGPAAPAVVAPAVAAPRPLESEPAIVDELIGRWQASLAASKRDIRAKSGSELFDFILADLQELKRLLFDPRSLEVILAAMDASRWLNEQLQAWLGEQGAADALTQSVPHNVTSEMGLALLDVADALRPHPQVVAFLQRSSLYELGGEGEDEGEGFLERLARLAGGREAREALETWLERYGMRGVGEIDVTRPRWSERPATLVPMLLGHIKRFEAGAGARRFEQGRLAALKKEQELLRRLRASPDGERKAEETQRMVDRVRTFIGYREYPKYGMVCRFFVYKQALLEEAERLVRARVLGHREDIYFLTFQELHDVVRTGQVDGSLLRQRQDSFRAHQALSPPRVLTSDGEALGGAYRRDDVPGGALVGLAVSAGTVEGRARVILDLAEAELEAGDILVTAFTDPSWTSLFVAIKGLVTEVGGLMTHGAVIAREYGVPAVVGVEHATRRIRDGQRIRVHGTEGYVELLSGEPPDSGA